MLPNFEGTQRFAIVRTLGAGSFGVVYEAVDQVTTSRVALKTLKNVSAESLYRLKREFRSLCDMAHPNLVQLYELFAEDAGWFFTMELVDGVPFTQYTWRAHTGPAGFDSAPTEPFTQHHLLDIELPRTATTVHADLSRLENALPQLVRAVARLHRDGKLHRDLKPSNVLVTAEGRVVVLDFGLVIDYTADSTASMQLGGTPSYMSPEQSRADVLTPASDWYSVGAMLYEVLTGEPPFAGETLRSKQSREPLPPSQTVRGIPTTLEQLCVRLLRLDPSQRPGAEEILEALERRGLREETRPAPRATFVGRETDLETLRNTLDDGKAEGAVVVCVEGVSGIGKSTFVRKFLDDAAREHAAGDLLILSGRCYERESVPYKAVDAIIDELHRHLRSLDARSVQALLPRDFPALAQLFPVLQALSDVNPSRRPQLAADSQEVRRRGFAALREMFQRMSDRMRVALFVDDLQWGDVDSADLLLEILRGDDAPAILFIGAYRSGESESPFLRVFLDERTGLRLQRVRLEPLASADVRRLAESLLGTADARIAQLVADGAAGSPFLADTLVRALAIDESLLVVAETGVSTLLHRIVSQLDADPQRVLHLIAVNGRPLPAAVLQTALKGGAYQSSMGTLRSEHLVRTVGRGDHESFEIYHDRMREMIIGSLPERTVRRYHLVLVDLLEAHGSVDAELLAVHAAGAGDEERAARYLVLAAQEAAAALAFERAARLYARALAVTSDRDPRFEELKTRRADMLMNAGRGSEAAAEYLAVPTDDEFTKLRLRTKAGQQLLFSGFIDRGLDVYRTVLAAAGMRWPETQLQTIAMFVAERLRLTLRGFRTRDRDESSIDANQLIRLDTSWSVAVGLSTVDPPRGAVFQTRHLRLALDAGEPNRLARALATESAYSAAPGEPTRRRAEKLLRRSRDLAGRLSSPSASAYADFGEGIASHLLGEWQRGATALERAEETFLQSCTGVMWEIDTSRLFSLRCRWFLGDTASIISRTPRLLRDAEERGDQYFRTMIRVCLSPYARMVEDAADRAVADLEGAMRDWSPSGLQYQHIWYVRAMADLALYRNDATTARTVIEDFWPRLRRSLLWRVQFTRVSVMDVRARAALAAAHGTTGAEREELIGLASKMARGIESEKTLWGKPFASIIRAAVARLRNDRQSAAESLVEAARRAERCSMRLYEAAARIRLADVDGSTKNVADAATNRDSMSGRGIRNPESMARMLVP